jgi:hypothetical protein
MLTQVPTTTRQLLNSWNSAMIARWSLEYIALGRYGSVAVTTSPSAGSSSTAVGWSELLRVQRGGWC